MFLSFASIPFALNHESQSAAKKGLSIFVNFHVFNSSKNNLPPNKTIMKIATMSGRGLLVIVLIAAAIAFY